MVGKGRTHALFVVRKIQEKEKGQKKSLYICFVDIKMALNIVTSKVKEWTIRKKSLPEVIVRAGMTVCHGASTKVKLGSELFEQFLVQVGVHQRSVLSLLLFAIAVNVITENARERLMNENLYARDMVLVSESYYGRFWLYRKFVRKGFEIVRGVEM